MTETSTQPRYAYVLGVDPGTTTGLALARFDMEDRGRPEAVWSDQLPWDEACAHLEVRVGQLHGLLQDGEAVLAAVAPEEYTINANTAKRGQAGANDALGMLGVARRACAITEVEFGPRETASAAKNLIQDRILKSLKIYAPAMVHCNDAYRHALLFATKRRWMNPRWLVHEAGDA